MDWGTTLQRRGSREPLDKGGWSLFTSVTPVPESRDPLLASLIRGNGKDAWFGWPSDPKIEAIYAAWLDAANPQEQMRLERDYQLAALSRCRSSRWDATCCARHGARNCTAC